MIKRIKQYQATSHGKEFWAGMTHTLPFVLGAIPFGVSYGILSVQAGLSIVETQLMSIIVFAGAAQFMALGMIQAGVSAPLIIMSTFLINLRHMVMGLSLSPYLAKTGPWWHRVLAFGMTDESYIASITHYRKNPPEQADPFFALGSSTLLFTGWQLMTIAGTLTGSSIANPLDWGLDFAMPATFLVMLLAQITSQRLVIVAATSGVVGTLSYLYIPGKWYIIIATLAACLVGLALEWVDERRMKEEAPDAN